MILCCKRILAKICDRARQSKRTLLRKLSLQFAAVSQVCTAETRRFGRFWLLKITRSIHDVRRGDQRSN